jgi:hypothetical protein
MNSLNFSKEKIYLSLKSGPSGPATLTAQEGLLAYSYPEMQAILDLTDGDGKDYFCEQYKYAWDNDIRPMVPSALDSEGNPFITEEGNVLGSVKQKTCDIPLGKVSFVHDPEGKKRIIAIVDYYTQLFLRPLHDELFRLVRKIPMDRSFTQDPRHTWVKDNNSY